MNVIISPVITEKSMIDAGNGKFTFAVGRFVNKDEIKKAIEKKFSVHVVGISTSVIKGKSIRSGARRTEKKLTPSKKAIVTLKKGEKIGMFELGDKK
jgi:large subunit ribosomal protein L23